MKYSLSRQNIHIFICPVFALGSQFRGLFFVESHLILRHPCSIAESHVFYKKPERRIPMIYYTGDIHGSPYRISRFAIHKDLTHEDIIVILGDVGANYFCDERDNICKEVLNSIKPTLFCIHGNHEIRPSTISSYKTNCSKSSAKSKLPSQLFSVLFVKGFGFIINLRCEKTVQLPLV